MTCEQARNLLKGAWTVSAAIAFERHYDQCPACHDFVMGLVGHIPEAERKAAADDFRRNYAPLMLEAILNDPEI